MPSIDRNNINAQIQMPRDTPVEVTDVRVKHVAAAVGNPAQGIRRSRHRQVADRRCASPPAADGPAAPEWIRAPAL